MWTIAKVLDGFADLPSEKYHTFAVKKNGVIVGQLKWKNRPKNAGGAAWQGRLFKLEFGMDVCFYSKNKQAVLDWFKTQM